MEVMGIVFPGGYPVLNICYHSGVNVKAIITEAPC